MSCSPPLADIDLVVDPGRALEPFAHLRAGDLHGADGVRIDVDVRHVLDGERTGLDLGEVVRTAASAGLEGRRRREQRQILEGVVFSRSATYQACASATSFTEASSATSE